MLILPINVNNSIQVDYHNIEVVFMEDRIVFTYSLVKPFHFFPRFCSLKSDEAYRLDYLCRKHTNRQAYFRWRSTRFCL